MADEEKTEEGVQETPKEQEKTFTETEVNTIVEERLARQKKKFADYDEIKEAALNAERLAKRVSSLEKELEEINAENSGLKHEKEVETWKKNASKEFGVDASILRGETEEDIKAHAEQIKKTISYPKVDLGGDPLEARVGVLSDRQKTEKAMSGLFVD